MTKRIKAMVIGASGYTGAELVRLLHAHPQVDIVALTGESNAGAWMSELYPHFQGAGLPQLVHLDEVDYESDYADIDVAFCCLPHATSQEVIKSIPDAIRVIDLSADFRIRDPKLYETWYGEHLAPELQPSAVYGLSERYREQIHEARLVACPGCYPTSILLPLMPLLEESVITPANIIADSKSGISGAGRAGRVANLFAEVSESVRPYGVSGHRHVAEIEQELSVIEGKEVIINFTPQVVPMARGILSCIYVELGKGKTVESAKTALQEAYANAPFVHIAEGEHMPATKEVRGSNACKINVFEDRLPNRIIILSVIDNLLKGASGQSVQNMNIMFGLEETTGLTALPVYP